MIILLFLSSFLFFRKVNAAVSLSFLYPLPLLADEIEQYFLDHPEVAKRPFVILDDRPLTKGTLSDFLQKAYIKTDPKKGLTEANYEVAQRVLTSAEWSSGNPFNLPWFFVSADGAQLDGEWVGCAVRSGHWNCRGDGGIKTRIVLFEYLIFFECFEIHFENKAFLQLRMWCFPNQFEELDFWNVDWISSTQIRFPYIVHSKIIATVLINVLTKCWSRNDLNLRINDGIQECAPKSFPNCSST